MNHSDEVIGMNTEPQGMNSLAVSPQPMTAMGNALVAREVQAVQGAIISAKHFPRDEGDSLKRIEAACERTRLAETAMYSYPRGGQTVTGPSIRLAEVLALYWKNIDTGWRILDQDTHQSTVQAWAWDLETNVRKAIEFTVVHVRETKTQTKKLSDTRDIYELVANQASRRQRNCILAVIPGDIIEAAVLRCEHTLANKGNIDEKRKKLVEAFKQHDVSVDEIERKIGKKISALSSIDYVQMQKVWKSLEDGMSKKSDWFEAVTDPEKIKREQDAGANDTKLPHEQQADQDKKGAALVAFDEACTQFKATGGDVAATIKRDPAHADKWDIAIIQAATTMLNNKMKGTGK